MGAQMQESTTMGVRRFGRVNWLGMYTLIRREIARFMTVWNQTIAAPLVTAGLFLAVFSLAIGPRRGDVMGVPFIDFLAPGILMMTVIQNSFANAASSIVSAKVMGNIVDTLMPPLSPLEILIGYVVGGAARGLFVALAIGVAALVILGIEIQHPLWALLFVVLGGVFMASLGVVAAIFANKFDQMSAISNFIVTPLSFLSGTFYSIEALPELLQRIIHVNPVFYLIDGVRYGVIGTSDSSPVLGAMVCSGATVVIMTLCWHWFRIGYRIKP